MYSEEYAEEQETNTSSSGSFYQNNRVLVWIFIAVILIALAILILRKVGSSGSNNTNKDYSINIFPETEVSISPGSSYKLVAMVNNISNITIDWASSDEKIAKVEKGNVTAVNYGKVGITATYVHTDGKKYEATKEINVVDGKKDVAITNVSIKDGVLIMPTTGTYSIIPTITPADGYIFSKSFTSSNEEVVVVSNSGLVEAVSEGEAVITLDVNDGAFKKELKVIVSNDYTTSEIIVNPTKITLSKEITKIKIGVNAKISYTLEPEKASTSSLTWTSSDESVLTVDKNGIIQGVKEGKATIKLSSVGGVSDALEIEVESNVVKVTDFELLSTSLYLEIGQSQVIMPTIIPDDATDQTITCTSSNPAVANVVPNDEGISCIVMAQMAGAATITVKANSSDVTKIINISVSTPVDPGSSSGGGSCGSCKNKTCAAGKYCDCGTCKSCPQGYYCYNNQKTACPDGKSSVPNSSSYQDCSPCAKGYYTSNHKCVACPSGTTTKSSGATKKSDCSVTINCPAGQYLSGQSCVTCPANYWCKDNRKTACPNTRPKSPAGSKDSSYCKAS